MRLFSFRSKLILAMSLVVAGITCAVLFATQRSVKEVYLHLFDQQFHAQIDYFSDSRIKQSDAIAQKSALMAKRPELIEALQSGDVNHIYEIAFNELREYYNPQEIPGLVLLQPKDKEKENRLIETSRKRLTAPLETLSKSLSVPFVRVLDAKGNPMEPRDPPPELKKAFGKNKRQEQLREFARHTPPEALEKQEFGYQTTELENMPVQMRQCIVTPIFAPGKKAAIGALLLGIPVHDFGERTMFTISEKSLCTGLWVDGKIHMGTIPEKARENVAAKVAEGIKEGNFSSNSSQVAIDDVPYRVYFTVLNAGSAYPPAAEVCLYSLAEYEAAKSHLREVVLEFGGGALLLGIVLILLISDGFSKPIEELATATRRVGHGDFSAHVRVRSRDELGTLAASFNAMAEGLALKEKYKSVLAQVTDPEIAEELMSGQVSLGGECRHVSVLFCDIRGFTALTESMPPAEVIAMLNEHMTAMNAVVHEHYGVVDKFVGDLVMAIFGAPKSYGHDATHAARCALAMIEKRRALNRTSHHFLEVGIGLTTGEVVAGCMGSEDRLNYTVLGERVNLASRLCSQAGGMEILIDEATASHLPENSQLTPIQPLQLKGFSGPVAAFRLEFMGEATASNASEEEYPASEVSKMDAEDLAAT